MADTSKGPMESAPPAAAGSSAVPPPSYYEAAGGYPAPGAPQTAGYPMAPPAGYPMGPPAGYPVAPPGTYMPPGSVPPDAYGPPQPGFAPKPSAPPVGYPMAGGVGPGGYAPIGMPNSVVVQPGSATVVVVQQPVHFRDHSVIAMCPTCHQSVQTALTMQTGALTWLICVLLCFFCPILFCLPFCVDGLKDVVHRCPNCRTRIGIYSRI